MRISSHRAPLGAVLLVVSIALAGCSSAGDAPDGPGASDSPVPSSTPSPSSAPVSNDPAEWVIGFDGVGPLVLGGSVAAGLAGAAASYQLASADSCPNPVTSVLQSDSNPTIWVQAAGEGSDEVALVAVGGDILDDARTSGSPHTEDGIAVGSSLDQVSAAYPAGVLADDPATQAHRFVVQGADAAGAARYLVFEFSEDKVQTILVQATSDPVGEFCG